jgi:hypothetical protein
VEMFRLRFRPLSCFVVWEKEDVNSRNGNLKWSWGTYAKWGEMQDEERRENGE